jgi:hypothetical protein
MLARLVQGAAAAYDVDDAATVGPERAVCGAPRLTDEHVAAAVIHVFETGHYLSDRNRSKGPTRMIALRRVAGQIPLSEHDIAESLVRQLDTA